MGLQLPVVFIAEFKSHNTSFHERCRCAHCQEIVYLFYPVDDLRRRNHIAESPTGDGIRL